MIQSIDLISFMKVDREAGATSFWLAFSSNISVSEVFARAYTRRSGDKYEYVTLGIS